MKKKCRKCGEVKELNKKNFPFTKRDGFDRYCRRCRNEYQLDFYYQSKVNDDEEKEDLSNPLIELRAAIINNALETLTKKISKNKKGSRELKERNNAVWFFQSDDSSLQEICEEMDWPIMAIRAKAEQLIKLIA